MPEDGENLAISDKNRNYIIDVAKRTWQFFSDYMTKENNYLPPDNYQENRKNEIVEITSSTNIGLGILAVISAYDMERDNLAHLSLNLYIFQEDLHN